MASDHRLDPESLREAVADFKEGNPSRDDLKRVLADFVGIARHQLDRQKESRMGAFPTPMLDWLCTGVERYLSGEVKRLGQGLGLERRGRSSRIETEALHLQIAREVDAAVAAGSSRQKAFVLVAGTLGRTDIREIGRAYAKYRLHARLLRELETETRPAKTAEAETSSDD